MFAHKDQCGHMMFESKAALHNHSFSKDYSKLMNKNIYEIKYCILLYCILLFFFLVCFFLVCFVWSAAPLCQDFGCLPCMKMHSAWNKMSLNRAPTWPDLKCLSWNLRLHNFVSNIYMLEKVNGFKAKNNVLILKKHKRST